MTSGYMIGSIDSTTATGDPSQRLQHLDEKSLVEAAKAGHDAALEKLLSSHSKKILQTIYRITKNREDAEDAMQDAFLRALVHIKSFDSRSQFSTWLTRIAINSALTIVRKKRLSVAPFKDTRDVGGRFDPTAIAEQAPDPEARYAQMERAETIRKAVVALPTPLRQAVVLQRLRELSVAETAKKLGLSLAAARSRLSRARAALKWSLRLSSFGRQAEYF
jgi:RNA polymerase sigma factor (sigma-70 family)